MENHSKNRWVFLALGISTRRILQIKGRVRRGANPGYKIGDNKHGPPVFVIWMFWKTLGTWRKHPIYPILVIVSRESRLFGVPTPNIGNAVKMGQDGSSTASQLLFPWNGTRQASETPAKDRSNSEVPQWIRPEPNPTICTWYRLYQII